MRRVLFTACFVILLAGVVAAGETLDREFQVRSGGTLEFDLETGGKIDIIGWGRETVAVTAELVGRDADFGDLGFVETSDGVRIETDYRERSHGGSSSIDFEVRVPSVFNIEIDSMGGGISIEGVEGEFTGKTMGGALKLNDLRGRLKLTTMGGSVTLTRSDVDGKVTTMGGKALVEDVYGDVEVKSMGGNVVHRRVTRPDGASIGDQVKITTMGGNIDVPEAPVGADVHTMGGDITIDSARDFVVAETMGGDIRIDEVDGWVDATTMGGDVEVTLVGGHDVKITSMSGEITLTLPSGVGFDIEIELDYTKNSSRNYRIMSDFPLSIEETREWDYDRGSPRKTIFGTAAVEGGGHRVVLHNVNGNIHLKRGR